MNDFVTVLRLLVVVFYISSLWYDVNYIGLKFNKYLDALNLSFSGKWMYLTHWNMVLMICYFFIAFVNDLVGNNEISSKPMPQIRMLKDSLFVSITFPLSMFAGSVFWILYAIDRELIYPKIVDYYIPNWYNHTMHTHVIILVFLEMFLSFRQYPARKVGLKKIYTVLLVYIVCLYAIKFTMGFWVYPFLELLGELVRIVFFIGTLLLATFYYLLGEYLNGIVWKNEIQELNKMNKSKSK